MSNKTVLILLVTLAVSAVGRIAVATPEVQFDTNERVVGILGLDVSGDIYNVDFIAGSFNQIFGGLPQPNPTPTFWGNETGASAARELINNQLVGFPAPFLIGARTIFIIPTGGIGDTVGGQVSFHLFSFWDGDYGFWPAFDESSVAYAKFSEVSPPTGQTPEPSTLTMLCIGILCVLGYGLNRKRRIKR